MGSADTVADLLSNLPEAILHHIISFLPGWNAVLTSLIARRWRHLWTSVPCLDFDEGLFIQERTRASVLLPYHPHVLHNFIDRTLMLRHETTDLRALHLALHTACDRCRLDTWLLRAIRLKVQELDVSVDAPAESLVYIDLRCSEFLRVIKLRFPGSVLRLPLSGALSSLDTLVLDTVTISDCSFGEFISSRCPILKKLSLTKCVGAIDVSALHSLKKLALISANGLRSSTSIQSCWRGSRSRIPSTLGCSILRAVTLTVFCKSFCSIFMNLHPSISELYFADYGSIRFWKANFQTSLQLSS